MIKAKVQKFMAAVLAAIIAAAVFPALLDNETVLASPTYCPTVNVTTIDESGSIISEVGGSYGIPGDPKVTGETVFLLATPNPGFVLVSVTYGNGVTGGVDITKDMSFVVEDFNPVIDILFQRQSVVGVEWVPGEGGTGSPVVWPSVVPGTEITSIADLPDGWTAPAGQRLISWKMEDVTGAHVWQAGTNEKIVSETVMTAVYGNWVTGWEDNGANGVDESFGVNDWALEISKTDAKVPVIPGNSEYIEVYLKDGYCLKYNQVEVVGVNSNTVYAKMKMTHSTAFGNNCFYGEFTMPNEDVKLRFETKIGDPADEPAEPYESYPQITGGKAHVQDIGDVTVEPDPETSIITLGTTGQSKRIEQITINFSNPTSYSGTLQYRVHVQDIGWMDWVDAGNPAGTTGQCKRIEAIEIRLTGELADYYSVIYKVHIQDYGDAQGWVKDGTLAGTTGESKRIEELCVSIVPKGLGEAPSIKYRVHVQDYGWESKYACDGAMSGTSGQSKRLEGIEIFISGTQYGGGVKYKTHVQDIGWESSWSYDGEMSGTQGQSKRLEGISIELYGEIAQYYDIYYRVHAQDIGWLSWACNGDYAGTAGRSARLEGIQIVLVPKGSPVPGETYQGITSVSPMCFVEGFDTPVG
ncbi:MAG: hypothetical protein IK128_08230 [Clostridiales bacterium]|nr:hypothetical protein [Clostridiales bacterium]